MPCRSSTLAIFAAAFVLTGAVSAGAAVVVVGTAKGHQCYLGAKFGVEPHSSIKLCEEALRDGGLSSQDVAATHVNRGVLYDLVGRYQDAFNDFNRSIRINPDIGDGYLNRGVALIRLKRLDEALTDVQKAISLGVSQMEIAYYDRAVIYEQMGRYRDAYYDYKRSQEALPGGYPPAEEALKHFIVTRTPAPPKA
jgi:tetratricopeptide (TPR) repeat protein